MSVVSQKTTKHTLSPSARRSRYIPPQAASDAPHHTRSIFFFFYFIYFIYLFLAALGLCCCAGAFSNCGEWGLLFVAVCGLLIAVASLVAEHRL